MIREREFAGGIHQRGGGERVSQDDGPFSMLLPLPVCIRKKPRGISAWGGRASSSKDYYGEKERVE